MYARKTIKHKILHLKLCVCAIYDPLLTTLYFYYVIMKSRKYIHSILNGYLLIPQGLNGTASTFILVNEQKTKWDLIRNIYLIWDYSFHCKCTINILICKLNWSLIFLYGLHNTLVINDKEKEEIFREHFSKVLN